MIYSNELQNMKLLKKKFRFPVNPKDRKHGMAVTLLTPNIQSSTSLINGQNKFIDTTYFESYYFDKSVSYLINGDIMSECTLISDTYTTQYDIDSSLNEFFGKEVQKKIIFNGPEYDIDLARTIISIDHLENINSKWFKQNIQYPISITVYPSIVSNLPKNTSNSINLKSSKVIGESKFVELCYEGIVSIILKNINPNVPKLIISAYTDIIMNDELNISINTQKEYVFTIKKFLEKEYGNSIMVQCIRNNDYSKLGYHTIDLIYQKYKPLIEGKMDDASRIKRNITTMLHKSSNHIVDSATDNTSPLEASGNTMQPSSIPSQNVGKSVPVQQPPSIDDGVASQIIATKDAKDKIKAESYVMNDIGIDTLADYIKINECFITILDEATSTSTINQRLKNILYRDRIRANKDMYKIYDDIHSMAPNIKYAYTNYKRYNNRNIFIDLSYYNSLYFENSGFTKAAGIELYFSLISRMMKVAQENEYNNNTVIIPVNDWDINPETRMWMYREDINPISLIYHMMKKDISLLRETFSNMEIIFISDTAYFKMDLEELEPKDSEEFIRLIKRLRLGNIKPNEAESDTESIKKDSTSIIADDIFNKIEKNDNIIIHRLTGTEKNNIKKKLDNKNNDADNVKRETQISSKDIENKKINRDKILDKLEIEKNVDVSVKEKVALKVEEVAEKSNTTQDAIKTLENDSEFKKLYQQLENNLDCDRGPMINASRSARMTQLNNEILKKQINGDNVEKILERSYNYSKEELPEMSINVESMNEGWKHLTYASINRTYNPDDDIIAGIMSLSKMTYPISIRSFQTFDVSTSEDALMEYKVECENHLGKRFTLDFDVPILVDNLYMKLHGNIKNIEGQSTLIPILKTESDTVQMISNYKKIFFRIYGSTVGKTNVWADKIVKTLSKHTFPNIEVIEGDNSIISNQYELPIDYIDLGRIYSKIIITGKNGVKATIFFNQYEIRNNYKVDDGKGIPYAVVEYDKSIDILYYNGNDIMSKYLFNTIAKYSEEFVDVFNKQTRSTKYAYSEASIMSVKIPVVVITCYHVGLTKTLDLLGVKYEIREKMPLKSYLWNEGYDAIRFDGGCVIFKETPESSMLMNGLKVCDTESVPLANINARNTYLQFLDQFGGRIKADGLDNFYDCMIDPITEVILQNLNLPTDYVELLIYANNLLVDNKYNIHGDMSVRRIRRNELIAAYTIQCLYTAYGQYANQLKHGRDITMTMKRSAVIDAILSDNTVGDISIINALNEYSAYNVVSPRGISGMNSDRSYSLDKRTYDESMINILSLTTGFASTVGIPRQATIDANVSTVRGFAKPPKKEEMGSIKTMSMTEAISSFMSTRDDTFRSAMTDGQTTKHSVRCDKYMPALISNGADQALPLLSSNIFSFKAKQDGKVKTITDDYMILEYKDGKCDYVNLQNRSEKNSSTGIYISLKLDTELKEGQSFKAGHIVAQDNKSFKHSSGFSNNFAYSYGVLAKCAFMVTEACFEDSTVVTEVLSDALTTDIIKEKEISLDKNTNVYGMPRIGDKVVEGQVLMTIQTPYDDEDANDLISKLSSDGEGVISDLGKIPIKSKVTGWIHDIKIMRTCEIDELSPSLKKIVLEYERKINDIRKVLDENGIDPKSILPSTYKLDPVGNLKDTPDGVKIIIRMGYRDKFGIGDKLIYMNANKGVSKHVIPRGLEPYSLDRPDEKIHIIGSYISHDARMVTSNLHVAVINRLNIECARHIKDMLQIPYNVNLIE